MTATLLTDLTVRDICEGFVYNELEGKGLFGWGTEDLLCQIMEFVVFSIRVNP